MIIYGDFVSIGNVASGNSDILSLNPGIREKLLQAKRPVNRSSNGYSSEIQPLVLLHFSDCHGYEAGVSRAVEVMNAFSDMIDDTLFTGDMVRTRWEDGISHWSGTSGTEKILVAIGNHDVTHSPYNLDNRASQSEQYQRYIAPGVANWGVTYTADKTYYYKDYTSKKVRLIVLNCMLIGDDATAQLNWFANVLSEANTKGYTVVAAEHYIFNADIGAYVECNYTGYDIPISSQGQFLPVDYVDAVKTYKNNGGKFACWFAGHTHLDLIVYAETYDQYCITVDASSIEFGNAWSNTQRTEGTKSQDALNLAIIDTVSTTVKLIRVGANIDRDLRPKNCIVFNYKTGKFISQT